MSPNAYRVPATLATATLSSPTSKAFMSPSLTAFAGPTVMNSLISIPSLRRLSTDTLDLALPQTGSIPPTKHMWIGQDHPGRSSVGLQAPIRQCAGRGQGD